MKTVVEMNFACISIFFSKCLSRGVDVWGVGEGYHVDQNIKISIKWLSHKGDSP